MNPKNNNYFRLSCKKGLRNLFRKKNDQIVINNKYIKINKIIILL